MDLNHQTFPLNPGFEFLDSGKYEEALNFFLQATSFSFENPDAFIGLGHAYHGLNQFENALTSYQIAFNKGSMNGDIHKYIGNTAYITGKWELARDSFVTDFSLADSSISLKSSIQSLPFEVEEHFASHYYNWRHKRIKKVIEHFSPSWFKGKSILELACGYGDIGIQFQALGADVSFLDGRGEHLNILRNRYPDISESKIILADLDDDFDLPQKKYDLIIHFGVLYHLNHWQRSLKNCSRYSKNLVLETEVCDSDDADFYLEIEEEGYDQSLSKRAVRASAPAVEKYLKQLGYGFEMLRDSSCNSDPHVYDWHVKNTHAYGPQFRRLWFCKLS